MERKKRPWYIWFSLLALALLWGDTARRIKGFRDGNFVLWNRACGNFLKLITIYFIIPMFLIPLLTNFIFGVYIAVNILLAIIYFLGVFATCKHIDWRNKNISHLLKSNKVNDVDKARDDLDNE